MKKTKDTNVLYQPLQRGLKTRHISLIALGGIIGSSYFLGTGYLLNQVGPCACLAYILGGLISYLTLACLAELAVSSPSQGSFVHAAAMHISPSWACGVGWSYWFCWVIYIPSECIGGALIMNYFVPEVPQSLWAVFFGLIITLCNVMSVKIFGEAEFWLALLKIVLLIGFCIVAGLILLGWVGFPKYSYSAIQPFSSFKNMFPNGISILFINMLILMANFQGSEIIGLTATEAEHPKEAVPKALEKVSLRIIGLYIIPTLLLSLLLPWKEAGLDQNAFSMALNKYGLSKLASIFSFVIVTGAISSSNGGLYATIRTLFSLGERGMGPKCLTKVSSHGIPIYATVYTLLAVWLILLLSIFGSLDSIYALLLATSGFTGSICWISICWSQLIFRKHFKEEGVRLTYRVPLFPYLTHFAIWLQVFLLFVVLFYPNTRASFYLGMPVLLLPMLIYKKFRSNDPDMVAKL